MKLHVPGNQMPPKDLRIADLPPIYRSVSYEEAIEIASLGAAAYETVGDTLRTKWTTKMGAEETAKADSWRAEGRKSALEELKERLSTGDVAIARVAALQSQFDAEVKRRTEEVLVTYRKECEVGVRGEVHLLETQLAEMKGAAKSYAMLEEAHNAMRDQIALLQTEVAKYTAATSTKSSHAIGKIGEAMVLDMLNSHVLPRFPYAEVRDMTAVKHMGDFHLWVFGPTGKRVKIMLDVKKYASPVQNIEVEKLYSDMDGDDADAGIMVSLDSAICNKTQFQIMRTKQNKPCIFLSFDKLDDGIRQEVLCWAIRVLVSVVMVNDTDAQDKRIAEINTFMADMTASVSELDTCLKSAKTLHDMLRDMRERMLGRITAFKGADDIPLTVATAPSVYAASDETRCKGKNSGGGAQCKSRRIPTGNLCSRHEAMMAEGKIVLMVDGV